MIILYTFLFVILIVLLGSIVPIFQVLKFKKKQPKTTEYVFSEELVNRDIQIKIRDEHPSRILLASRGWVRGPQGKIITNDTFEQKKLEELSIELP